MTEQEERAKLLALAYLKNGVEPSKIEDLTGVTHAACLKLRRELREAELNNSLEDLFGIEADAIDVLLESLTRGQVPMLEPYPIAQVKEEVGTLIKLRSPEEALKEDTYKATSALINKIQSVAAISTNVDTIIGLAEALARINDSFFPHTKDTPGQGAGDFERYLGD